MNLTRQEFADAINMSIQGYRNIEHNRYMPTPETINRICTVFKKSPIDLLLQNENKDLSEIKKIINIKLQKCNKKKLLQINSIVDLL